MALVPCPDCGTEVSPKAEKCPKCGRVIKKSQSAIGILAAIIIGLIIGYFIFHLLGIL